MSTPGGGSETAVSADRSTAEPATTAGPATAHPGRGKHRREGGSLLADVERDLLRRIAAALPDWIMPDHLTALGLVASTAVAACYLLSNRDPAWLWAASGALVVQWFGDSLDGTLARVRRTERPRYGFYLDHLTDAYSTLAIGLGLGLSPYMLLSVGLAIVIGYFALSINVYLETHVMGEFRLGHGRLGPTEARILLIALNLLALAWRGLPFSVFGVEVTLFDVGGLLAVAAMVGLLVRRAGSNLSALAKLEPPAARRG